MRYVPRGDWPDWVKARIGNGKNLEVKESNNYWYLYKRRSVWDKTLKRPRKIVKYVAALKKSTGRISEHGHVAFVIHLLSKHKILGLLKECFPYHWREILLFSMNRVIYPSPLKRMGSWMEKTTLDNCLEIGGITGKRMSGILGRVGTNVKAQKRFMEKLIKDRELLLYDGSVIYSTSGYNKLLEIGYDKGKLFLPKANITLLFSKDRNVPVHFRLFFGSVHEIKTVKSIISELKERNILFIADKGYYKNKLYEDLNDSKIKFIMPLPRDDKRIDYAKELVGVFRYHKRIIRCTASYKADSYYLYSFEDQYLKYSETDKYYRMKLKKRKNLKFDENWAGKITLISNKRMKPQEAYQLWKSRDIIEKAFNILQNYLETDHPYVSHEDVFRGYMFASFISLLTYYLVLNVLQKYDINGTVSVDDILFEFSKIMVEDVGYPLLAEIPKKVKELAKKVNVWDIVTKNWES